MKIQNKKQKLEKQINAKHTYLIMNPLEKIFHRHYQNRKDGKMCESLQIPLV